jgi:hypothetical protein
MGATLPIVSPPRSSTGTSFALGPAAVAIAAALSACGSTGPAVSGASGGSGQSSGTAIGDGSSGASVDAASSGAGYSGSRRGEDDGGGSGTGGSGESSGSSTGGTPDAGKDGEIRSSGGSGEGGGSDNGPDGSGGDNPGGAAGPFACNLLIGNSTTQQFFDGGFLTYPGVDASKWELLWKSDHYIDLWANPMDSAWDTPFDEGHTCSTGSTTPDHVIFVATRWPPSPESYYTTNLTNIVKIIQAKYPTVKRTDLMTLIRAPGNKGCDGTQSEQTIPPAEDQGVAATAAAFPGLVFSIPPQYVPRCADFVSATAPQYSATPGAGDVGKVYGQYFAASP